MEQKKLSYSKTFNMLEKLMEQYAPEEIEERDKRIQQEEEERERRQRQKAFKGCGIGEDHFDCTFQNYTANLPEQKKVLSSVWEFYKKVIKNEFCVLVMYGNPGTGKTHLCSALLKAVSGMVKSTIYDVNIYYTVRYTKSDSLCNRLKNTQNFKSNETYDEVVSAFSTPDLLVIDEAGRNPLLNINETDSLFAVIDKRKSQNKSFAVCSDCNWKEFNQLAGSASMSRILQNAIICDMSGIPDYRLKK